MSTEHVWAERDRLKREVERLTIANASLREAGRRVEEERDHIAAENVSLVERLTAERDDARKALELVLKHAASEEFWQRQSVDHWDKPGPHNAAVNALKAINFAKRVGLARGEGEASSDA